MRFKDNKESINISNKILKNLRKLVKKTRLGTACSIFIDKTDLNNINEIDAMMLKEYCFKYNMEYIYHYDKIEIKYNNFI